MSDEKIRHAYRICPCSCYDVEGIQTWLENMASQGLVLEADGTFLGIFTFQKTTPRNCQYRLAPIKERSGFLSDSTGDPDEEEQDFSRQCGWEYLTRYGQFYIYRATGRDVRPLHTDATVHIMALEAVKKQQRGTIIGLIGNLLIYSILTTSVVSFFRSGAVIGVGFLLSLLTLALVSVGKPVWGLIQLTRYQKRLRQGDSLDRPKPWQSGAFLRRCVKLLPVAAIIGILVFWGISLDRASRRVDVEVFTPSIAIADLQTVFPDSQIQRTQMGDYNTAVCYSTALSDNMEWNEAADITDDSGSHYCILRLEYHDTVSPLFARGLANDYYRQERLRYHGKRFEDITPPKTKLEDVRVYSSYGIVHVLIRHENIVVHGAVSISQQGQGNHWQRWLFAMEEILLHEKIPC